MYHAHRYAKEGWAGEPELDPTQGYEEREQVEGWELTPEACLKSAHDAVLRERAVVAGQCASTTLDEVLAEHGPPPQAPVQPQS